MGVVPKVDTEKRVDVRQESLRVSPQVVDSVLDLLERTRAGILDTIGATFRRLPEFREAKGNQTVEDAAALLTAISSEIALDMGVGLSETQRKVPGEFARLMKSLGASGTADLGRGELTSSYLGVWSVSCALLLLSYLTFAHESTTRYPRVLPKGNTSPHVPTGCDDYGSDLAIVSRIGRIGYITSLALNDMDKQLEAVSLFFRANG